MCLEIAWQFYLDYIRACKSCLTDLFTKHDSGSLNMKQDWTGRTPLSAKTVCHLTVGHYLMNLQIACKNCKQIQITTEFIVELI